MLATMKIDPFELHPETPRLLRLTESLPITIGQLNSVVDNLVSQIQNEPDKLWGRTKGDIEYWLRMVVHEAEKIAAS